MDIQNIFANGLPQELKNLQDGQIYIFLSPDEGITEKSIRICQYICSLAKQNNIKDNNKPAVFVIPTDNDDLWDCMFCLVDNPNGKFLEIAEITTLTKMVYDLWGLNLGNMPTPAIAKRYKAYNISISDSHPVRIPLGKRLVESSVDGEKRDTTYDWLSPSLGYLTTNSLSAKEVRATILTALFEAEYNKERFGVDYNLEELLTEFHKEKDKTYRLEIVPEKVDKKVKGLIRHFIDCHIYFTDENDERQELKLKQQEKAVYLVFLLHKDGIYIKDFATERKKSDDEYKMKYRHIKDLYVKIQSALLDNNHIEEPELLKGEVSPIINKIKKKISYLTPNKKCLETFAIEGYKEKPYKIAAATQEHRDIVIEAFKISPQTYGL